MNADKPADRPHVPLPPPSTPPLPAAPLAATPRATLPLAPDLTLLETGLLGDPSTALVTALARITGPQQRISTEQTSLLAPSACPAVSSPTHRPAGAVQAARAAVAQHQQRAQHLRRRAAALQAQLQREAHETQTLLTRYEALRRQVLLGARDRADLQELATILPQRSAQLAAWRGQIQQLLLEACRHDEAAAALARAR